MEKKLKSKSSDCFRYYIFTLRAQQVWRIYNGIIIDLTNQTKDVKVKVPMSKKFNKVDDLFEDLGLGL